MYGDRMYSAALILELDAHNAENLVSRTMRQAVVKIDRYDPAYSFWNWLYTIMLNFYRTDRRKRRAEVARMARCASHGCSCPTGTLLTNW